MFNYGPQLLLVAALARAQDNPLPRASSVTVHGFRVEMRGCAKGAKTITCSLTLTNLQADRRLALLAANFSNTSYFVDSGGIEVTAQEGQLGVRRGSSPSTELVTDTPVKGSVEFPIGDPKATSLAKLSFAFNVEGDVIRADFRKVPIEGQ